MFFGGYGFGAYGGFDYDDDGLNRGDWSEKSDAASAREASARAAFTALLATQSSKASTVELLKPSTHLTQPCWRDFKKFVGQHAGWSAKRRQASDAEKRQHGETRKGAVYFVDVAFKPPAQTKSGGTGAAGKKTIKKTPLTPAVEAAATAQMAAGMSSWMSSGAGKRPRDEEADDEDEDGEDGEDEPAAKTATKKSLSVTLKRVGGKLGMAIDEDNYVTAVHPGGAAALEGIAVGDLIREVNGKDTGMDAAVKLLPKDQKPVKLRLQRFVEPEKQAAASKKEAAVSKKACIEPSAATGCFEVRFSRASKVVEWDEQTFTDCRPSEASDSMDEHVRAAKKYDFANQPSDDVDGGNSAMLPHLRAAGGVFDTVTEANDAAKKCMATMLELEAQGDGFTLTAVRDGTDAEWSTGFKPPPSSTVPTEALGADGRGRYTGKITLFCDVHGCDVHNVVVSELTATVVAA
jgi:hypothetical protein